MTNMRLSKFIIFAFIIFFIFFNNAFANQYAPDWYKEQKIPYKTYEFIGYGEGKTLDEAINNAKGCIAGYLGSTIYTDITIIESLRNERFGRDISKKLRITNHAVVTDIKEVRREFFKDKYFIAIKYINLPLFKKAVVVLGKHLCSNKNMPVFLTKNPFYEELEKELKCKPYFEIIKMNNFLTMFADTSSIILRKEELRLFLQDIHSSNITITTPTRSLKENSLYFLTIQAKQQGFISSFNINEKGQVFKLFENKKTDKKIIYPDAEKYNGLEALISEGMQEGKDLYVAVFSENQIDFSLFISLSANVDETEYYDFPKFIKAIDNYDFAAIVIRTTK